MPSAMNAILPQISSNANSVNTSSSSTSSSSSKGSFASTLASCTQSQNSTTQGSTAQSSSSVYNSATNDPSSAANAAPQAQQQSAAQAKSNATSDTSQGTTASTTSSQDTVSEQSKMNSDNGSHQEATTPLAPDSQTPVSVYGMLAAVAVQVAVQKTTTSVTGTIAGGNQQGVDPASAVQAGAANGQQASISPVVTQQTMAPTLLQAVANQTVGKGQPTSASGNTSDVSPTNTNAAPSAGSLTSDAVLNGLPLSPQTGVSSPVQEVMSTTLQAQTLTNGNKSDVVTKVADLFSKGQNDAMTNATDLSGKSNIAANSPMTGSQALSGSIGQNGSAAADLLQYGQNNSSSAAQSDGNSAALSAAQVLADKLTVTKQTAAQGTGNQTGNQEKAAAANHDPLAVLTALGAQTNQQNLSDHSQNSFGLKEDKPESLLANHKEEGSNASATASMNFSQILGSDNSSTHPEAVSSGTTSETATLKDSFQVVQQIVDQAKLITGDQSNEMIIKLKPEHLGELTLKVTVEQGLVTATFHSGNSDVRAAIESSLPQLKQELANSGLKVDNVGVYTSLNQFMSNQQQSQQPQQQAKIKYAGKNRSEAAESFEDVVQPLTEISATGGSDGVDYLI